MRGRWTERPSSKSTIKESAVLVTRVILMSLKVFMPGVGMSKTVGIAPSSRLQPQNRRGDHNIGQGQWNEPAPAQIHQLIEAEARQHPSHPHDDDHKNDNLAQKNRDLEQSLNPLTGCRRLIQPEPWQCP